MPDLTVTLQMSLPRPPSPRRGFRLTLEENGFANLEPIWELVERRSGY